MMYGELAQMQAEWMHHCDVFGYGEECEEEKDD